MNLPVAHTTGLNFDFFLMSVYMGHTKEGGSVCWPPCHLSPPEVTRASAHHPLAQATASTIKRPLYFLFSPPFSLYFVFIFSQHLFSKQEKKRKLSIHSFISSYFPITAQMICNCLLTISNPVLQSIFLFALESLFAYKESAIIRRFIIIIHYSF